MKLEDVQNYFVLGMVDLCNGDRAIRGMGTIQERLVAAWLYRFVAAYPPDESVPQDLRERMISLKEGLTDAGLTDRASAPLAADETALGWVRELREISDDLGAAHDED